MRRQKIAKKNTAQRGGLQPPQSLPWIRLYHPHYHLASLSSILLPSSRKWKKYLLEAKCFNTLNSFLPVVYRSEEDVYRVEVTHEKPVKIVDKVQISV